MGTSDLLTRERFEKQAAGEEIDASVEAARAEVRNATVPKIIDKGIQIKD